MKIIWLICENWVGDWSQGAVTILWTVLPVYSSVLATLANPSHETLFLISWSEVSVRLARLFQVVFMATTMLKGFTLRLPQAVCALQPLVTYTDLLRCRYQESTTILKPWIPWDFTSLIRCCVCPDMMCDIPTGPRSIRHDLTPSSLSKSSTNLNIKFFAKRNCRKNILLAQTQVQVNDDTDSKGSQLIALTAVLVPLAYSMDSQLKTTPFLVLKITILDRFMDFANAESHSKSIQGWLGHSGT